MIKNQKIVVHSDYVSILCYSRKYGTREIKVDLEYLDYVSKRKWNVYKYGETIDIYAKNMGKYERLTKHITGYNTVSYKNGDFLDLRKSNVSTLTKPQVYMLCTVIIQTEHGEVPAAVNLSEDDAKKLIKKIRKEAKWTGSTY